MSSADPSPETDRDAWRAWGEAAALTDVDVALRDLYARLDADIAARGPTCWQSGQCCKFGDYGHRLYVTALEVAWFRRQLTSPDADRSQPSPEKRGARVALPQADSVARDGDTCPYQVDHRCTTHPVRPLGCRIFFCQAGTQEWQQDLYERYLAELRQLHKTHGIEYRYADWLALLDESIASSN